MDEVEGTVRFWCRRRLLVMLIPMMMDFAQFSIYVM